MAGPFFTAALHNMKPGGRIAVCGAIAIYNDTTPQLCMFTLIPVLIHEKAKIKARISILFFCLSHRSLSSPLDNYSTTQDRRIHGVTVETQR